MSNKATRDRWKTRRMMAWISFWDLVLAIPAAAIMYALKWIDVAFITAIAGIGIAVITGLFAIITTFIGAAAYDDVNYKKGNE